MSVVAMSIRAVSYGLVVLAVAIAIHLTQPDDLVLPTVDPDLYTANADGIVFVPPPVPGFMTTPPFVVMHTLGADADITLDFGGHTHRFDVAAPMLVFHVANRVRQFELRNGTLVAVGTACVLDSTQFGTFAISGMKFEINHDDWICPRTGWWYRMGRRVAHRVGEGAAWGMSLVAH